MAFRTGSVMVAAGCGAPVSSAKSRPPQDRCGFRLVAALRWLIRVGFDVNRRNCYATPGRGWSSGEPHIVEPVTGSAGAKMEDRPKSLKLQEYKQERRSMLDQPHVAPLTKYVRNLRKLEQGEVPFFDPMDGGISAKILFILQNPGKRTLHKITPGHKTPGSGFISRNNDDETAKNTFELLQEAGIPREDTLLWNIVPWYKRRDVTVEEIKAGAKELQKLFAMLPQLKVVVAVGNKAWDGMQYVQTPEGVAVRKSSHPSPLTINKWPRKRDEILVAWKDAYEVAYS